MKVAPHSHDIPAPGPPPRAIRPREFDLLRGLIERETGIHLGPAKKELLVGRLRSRVRTLGMGSFGEYYRHVSESRDEQMRMIDLICVNETHFFREPSQFDFLRAAVIPRWRTDAAAGRRGRRVRVWSAGCSTGEEPFSLAMILHEALPRHEGWGIEIHATDLCRPALARASGATWSIDRATEIPDRFLRRYMRRGVGRSEGRMRAVPELRSLVHVSRLNLNDSRYSMRRRFDLVLCRNVLIYFAQESRLRAIGRLLEHLEPEGLLFVGHAESLHGGAANLRCVAPTIYTLSPGLAGDLAGARGARGAP